MKHTILLLMLLPLSSFSVSVSQTDWSGDSGVLGPVSSWDNNYYYSTQVYCSDGNISLGYLVDKHFIPGGFSFSFSSLAVDIDNDGDLDVVGGAYDSPYIDHVVVLINTDSSGLSWDEYLLDTIGEGVFSIHAGDVDGDGDVDVLSATYDTNQICWYENLDGSGTTWNKHYIDTSSYNTECVYAIDLDEDGDLDVIGGGPSVIWWENLLGSGTTWVEHEIAPDFAAFSVFPGDMDADGDLDVLAASYWGNEIALWRNNDGSGTSWTKFCVDGTYGCASSVYASDVDGDGDLDVLGAARANDEITWWENTNGSGLIWYEHVIRADFGGASSVHAADLDNDGDIDVLGTALYDGLVCWWKNLDGSGTSWGEILIDCTFDGSSISAADINGDGKLDVLAGGYYQPNLCWFDLLGYTSEGILESSILNAQPVLTWISFSSISTQEPGSSLAFQFRSSDDSANMGEWSDTIFCPDTVLTGILSDSTDFLQYRVILGSSDLNTSPVLQELEFTYDEQLWIEESDPDQISNWDLSLMENPSIGSFSVQIAVPELSNIDLILYDLSGRIVDIVTKEYSTGIFSVNFPNIRPGIYFCVMKSGYFTKIERVAVLR